MTSILLCVLYISFAAFFRRLYDYLIERENHYWADVAWMMFHLWRIVAIIAVAVLVISWAGRTLMWLIEK